MARVVVRSDDEAVLRGALARAPVVLLTGPRQAGKSTLARTVVDPDPSHMFDLEDPGDAARLGEPMMSLPELRGTVVIDEAQRRQDLFPMLRVLTDRDRRPGRFLVLGSASPDLVGLAAESLAGRVALIEMAGFRVADVGTASMDSLWVRGGLPRSFLASTERESAAWRDDYISTFLERDLVNLGVRTPATTMRRFWMMLAHFHAQTWNGAELARALDISQPMVRRYVDVLSDALVVRQIQPWFANIGKRQVRSPKVYIRDSGLLHRHLGLADREGLLSHPKVGASWEGFILEQILALPGVRNPWFWATHEKAELDLMVEVDGRRVGIEIKRTQAPRITGSIRSALADLDLDRVLVVHAGEHTFPMAERVTAVSAAALLGDPTVLRAAK